MCPETRFYPANSPHFHSKLAIFDKPATHHLGDTRYRPVLLRFRTKIRLGEEEIMDKPKISHVMLGVESTVRSLPFYRGPPARPSRQGVRAA